MPDLARAIGAHTLWAKVEDRTAHTAPARKAFMDRFEREVDPDGKLSPEERGKRAENARKAYFARLALKSKKARQKKARQAVEAELSTLLAELRDGTNG